MEKFLECNDVYGTGEWSDKPPWTIYIIVGGVPLNVEFYDRNDAERVATLIMQVSAIADLYYRAARTDVPATNNNALSKLDDVVDKLLDTAKTIHDLAADLAAPMKADVPMQNASNAFENESED